MPSPLFPSMDMLVISMIGSSLCFALTVIYAAVEGGLEVSRVRASQTLTEQELKQLHDLPMPTEEDRQKLMYLEIRQLQARSVHQESLIRFQKVKFVSNLITSLVMPPLAFASLVLLPAGVGIGVLVSVLVTLSALKSIALHFAAPKPELLPAFDKNDFEHFLKNPTAPPLLSGPDELSADESASGTAEEPSPA